MTGRALTLARAGDENAFRELTEPCVPSPHTEIARPYGLLVLTLAGTEIAEITFFADSSVFPYFGLPPGLSPHSTGEVT